MMRSTRVLPLLLSIAAAADSGHAQGLGPLEIPGEPRLGGIIVGEGPMRIVALHGGPAFPYDYSTIPLSPLTNEGRIVFYDQRGCGLSAPADSYHWRDHVADLDRVINYFAPGDPVVLHGGSWGATLALLYAVEHPARVRALVLTGTPRWTDGRIGRMSIDSAVSHRLRSRCGRVAKATWESTRDKPGAERLRTISVPVLLISGSEDTMGAEELSTLLPRAQVVIIPEAGHLVAHEQPERYWQAIRQFLRGTGDAAH